MKEFKGHFSGPSHPSTLPTRTTRRTRPARPTRPIKLGPSGLDVRVFTGPPEGHCGCLVDWLHWKCLKPISLAGLSILLASLRSAAGSMIFQKHTYIG